MDKFQRKYLLRVAKAEGSNEVLDIATPFSCDFNIMRSINGSANTGSFTIYNLNPDTRRLIYKDPFSIELRSIQFFAGYDNDGNENLPMLFNGFVKQAESYRQGADFLTVIEAFDGGYAMTEGQAQTTVNAGQKIQEVMTGLMKALPGIDGATVGDGYEDVTKRGQTIFGNPVEHLRMVTRNRFFIDKNHAYVLADDEILPGDIGKIDASTGLIGTPRKNKQTVEVELIFEPRVTICQALELESITFPEATGTYRVIEIEHQGLISPQVDGRVTTRLKLQIPPDSKLFKLVRPS